MLPVAGFAKVRHLGASTRLHKRLVQASLSPFFTRQVLHPSLHCVQVFGIALGSEFPERADV